MDFAKNLLKIAKQDLEAAKCLFESCFYPQAVFYLEQSIEKATKSWGILCKMINEVDVKDVGHDSYKVFINFLMYHKDFAEKQKEIANKVPKLKKFVRDFGPSHETVDKALAASLEHYKIKGDSLDKLKFLGNFLERFLFYPEGAIREQLIDIEKTEQELRLKFKEYNDISIKDYNKVKEFYFEYFIALYNLEDSQEIEKVKEYIQSWTLSKLDETLGLLNSSEGLVVTRSLIFLSSIMLPHAIFARYPHNNHDPLKIYNKNLPLIRLFGDLVKLMEKTLSKQEKLLEYKESSRYVSTTKP